MLRITKQETDRGSVLKLEGKLAGPWVSVLRDSWKNQLTVHGARAICVDLRAVTFIDAEGKALLAEMTRQNAQFDACDCLVKAILAEVSSSEPSA